jgi:hypothetical protein
LENTHVEVPRQRLEVRDDDVRGASERTRAPDGFDTIVDCERLFLAERPSRVRRAAQNGRAAQDGTAAQDGVAAACSRRW